MEQPTTSRYILYVRSYAITHMLLQKKGSVAHHYVLGIKVLGYQTLFLEILK